LVLKISAVIILLFCLLAPFSGSYIFLHLKKKQIRKEVKHIILKDLEEKDLVILKFTEEEALVNLKWKHAGEFEYRGHMYDVVDKSMNGENIIYTCYKDHKETRLNREKEKLFAKALSQDPTQKKQNERMQKFFKFSIFQDVSSWKVSQFQPLLLQYSFFTFHYSLFTQPPPSPPPKYS
jgi:hypothetical protein